MSEAGRIVRINPVVGIPGGEVAIECEGFDTSQIRTCNAWFEDSSARLVAGSTRRVLAIVPEMNGGEVDVALESNSQRSASAGV